MPRLPGKTTTFLNNNYNVPEFVHECAHFFGAHLDLLDQVILEVKSGKYLESIIKSTLEDVSSMLDDADRGVYLVLASGMPLNRFQKISSFNLIHNKDTGQWKRGIVGGVNMPNMWPSYK